MNKKHVFFKYVFTRRNCRHAASKWWNKVGKLEVARVFFAGGLSLFARSGKAHLLILWPHFGKCIPSKPAKRLTSVDFDLAGHLFFHTSSA